MGLSVSFTEQGRGGLEKSGRVFWGDWRSLRALLVFPFFSLFLGACGYTLVGKGRSLPESIHSVSIPILENSTPEPNIEVTVSNILVNEFIIDGRLKVSKPEDADLIINGSVSAYRIRPVSFDSNDNVETYRLELEIDMDVKELKSGNHLLKQSFQGEWDFNATADITVTEPQRAAAIKSAARDAARKMISILIEGF